MIYKWKIITVLTLSLLFSGCGGSSSSGNNSGSVPGSSVFTDAEKQYVYGLFTTEYLWFDEVATDVDLGAFSEPQALIDGMKAPQDRWSFSVTAQEYDNIVNQATQGFGFGYVADFTVYTVRIDSPAYGQLYRGDKILEVNGQPASIQAIAAASQNLNVPSTFTVLRAGQEISVTMTPRPYSFKVTLGKVVNGNVGYLRYDAFTGTSAAELETEFTKFKAAGIRELVIDLRYNGGGSIDAASVLLDNITNQYAGQRQVYLDWNANYKSQNSEYYFSTEIEANDLSMQRVIFLVTRDSASASELVISALKPYLGNANVVTIGDATHGKPVGMAGRSYGNNYYFLVNFYVRNNLGETTSLNGIPPTCPAADDLSHLQGDPEETMFKTALNYINTGHCL